MKKKVRKEKIGLVLTGGGMRCAYSAGALIALHEVYGFDAPYALGAGSGSAGNAFYYLARQYALARPVWTKHLATKKFVSKRGIQIDYLIDTVFKKLAPLDVSALSRTKTKYFITVGDARTGEVRFVTNKSIFDRFEVLRAATAVPILYGKKVRLGLGRYIDGEVVSDIENLAKKVLGTGVTTLITINCEPPHRSAVSKVFLNAKALASNSSMRKALMRDLSIPTGLCPTGTKARAYCIGPSRPLKVESFSCTKEGLVDAYELGYNDIAKSKELQKLFGKHT